jgi:predicted alpha/beta-fold hydrolase
VKDYSDEQAAVAAITEMQKMLSEVKDHIVELANQRLNQPRQDSLTATDYSREQISIVNDVKSDPTASAALRGMGHDRFIRGLLPEINRAYKSVVVFHKRAAAKAKREGLTDE